MAESVLWNELKAKRLGGYKFVRQMPLGPYIADFACRGEKLVIELDGSQHAGSTTDRRRDQFMQAKGYSVLRIWNVDALKNTTSVCETVLALLEGRLARNTITSDLRFLMSNSTQRGSGS